MNTTSWKGGVVNMAKSEMLQGYNDIMTSRFSCMKGCPQCEAETIWDSFEGSRSSYALGVKMACYDVLQVTHECSKDQLDEETNQTYSSN